MTSFEWYTSFIPLRGICIAPIFLLWTDMQFGRFVKYKKIKDIKITVKEWIMEYATKGQPFLGAVQINKLGWRSTLVLSIT